MKDFKDFKIKDREFLENFFLNHNDHRLCEFNFSNLYGWGEIYQIVWKDYDGRILMYNGLEDVIYFPVGNELDPSHIVQISDRIMDNGKSGSYMFVPEYYVKKYEKYLKKDFELIYDENNFDYIYSAEKLAFLPGRKLSKKRNLISQFERNFPDYKTEFLRKQDSEECLELANKWCQERICDVLGFSQEMSAIGRIFDRFDDLPVEGIVVKIEEKIKAFSIFSRLYKDCYDTHFEKFDTSIKGLAQIINRETAKYLNEKCEYINREQDMGIDGLRKSKRSYFPDKFPAHYILERKK